MAKGAYIGVDGKARKVKKGYVGVDGKARKIKKAYIGIGGVAMPFFGGGVEEMVFTYTGNMVDSGVVTMSGKKYRLLQLTSSGTLTAPEAVSAEVWMCGGGTSGRGAYNTGEIGGGGGAGAFTKSGTVLLSGSMTAVIGAGGSASNYNADYNAGNSTSFANMSTSTDFSVKYTSKSQMAGGVCGGTGGGRVMNSSVSPAGTGDGVSKYPFGETVYFKPHCAGGGAGGCGEYSSGWCGSSGGTNGGSGSESTTYVSNGAFSGGSGGNYGGGAGGSATYENTMAYTNNGEPATFYGSGGGGGSGIRAGSSYKRKGSGAGYQGVIYIRIPVA